jgi:RNA polymerase sigma-70 factor, ECF subfamily
METIEFDETTISNIDMDTTEAKELLLKNIMDQYSQEIMWLAYSYVKDYYIAEDLTQEVFVKCYEKIHTFKGESSLKTWLFIITINKCKDHLRSSYFKKFIPSIIHPYKLTTTKESPDKVMEKEYNKKTLSDAILLLPLKYREVIILFYFQDLKIKQISDLLNTNENTIKTRLRKAKKLLLGHYQAEEGGEELHGKRAIKFKE